MTFDDGTADFVDVALPILERHGVPVTIYLATAFIDDGVAVPGRRAAGIVVGADATRARPDWSTSARTRTGIGSSTGSPGPRSPTSSTGRSTLIGDRLGRAAVDFAYPKAVFGSPDADGRGAAAVSLGRGRRYAGQRVRPYRRRIASRDRRSRSATR